MNERPRALEQLGEELDRVAGAALRDGNGSRSALRAAPVGRLSAVAVGVVLLLVAAAAAAAVLLIQQGSPLPAPHAQDLRSSGRTRCA
jgi:ferric-dicitrate binding protein FerR (iron transport regulator)